MKGVSCGGVVGCKGAHETEVQVYSSTRTRHRLGMHSDQLGDVVPGSGLVAVLDARTARCGGVVSDRSCVPGGYA